MNISGINLNLLNVLKTLLQERNTTKTAKKLNTTQPNISRSLQILKAQFDDELLIRGKSPKTMDLTPKARDIEPVVNQLTAKIKAILDKGTEFNPKNINKDFKIVADELISNHIISKLFHVIDREAPNAKISIVSPDDIFSKNILSLEDVDIFLSNSKLSDSSMAYSLVFNSDAVCIASKKNSNKIRDLSMKNALKTFTHILSTNLIERGLSNNSTDLLYETLSLYLPNIKAVKLSYLDAFYQLSNGENYLMLLPKIIAENVFLCGKFDRFEIPYPIPAYKYHLYWDIKKSYESENIWLRELIGKIFEG